MLHIVLQGFPETESPLEILLLPKITYIVLKFFPR